MRARKARKHFGEITYGNHIVFTVDGEETFKPIYDAISQAESSIYIAGYDLVPSLNFVRGDGHNASNMGGGSLGNGITINRNSCLSVPFEIFQIYQRASSLIWILYFE